jgi:hypothetical protein
VVPEYRAARSSRRGRVEGRAGRLRGCQQRLVLVGVAAEHDDTLHVRQPVPQSVEKRRELGADYDEHGLAVVEDVDELLGGQPEVHDGVDGADRRGRQGQLHARGVVLVEHGEPVSWTHARGAQRPRGAPDAVVDLRPGPAPAAER